MKSSRPQPFSRTLALVALTAIAAPACAFEPATELDDPSAETVGEAEDEIITAAGADIDVMADEIHNDLSGLVVGYSFAIVYNGMLTKTGSGGVAKRPVDGSLSMATNRRLQVASVSKTIEAVATLKLLEANGLSVDSPVSPWLPAAWTRGVGWTGTNPVTFRHLLTHQTGLGQLWDMLSEAGRAPWDNDWDGLQYVVSLGASAGSAGSYKNANFALLRVILPALWKAAPSDPGIGAITKANYGSWHLLYMQQNIFSPAGIQNVGCSEVVSNPTAYAYDVNAPNEAGHPAEVSIDGCGGHAGWHLSAYDLAAFMAYTRYDNSYFSPANRALMDNGRLGWDDLSNTNSNGRQGKYWHGGAWDLSSDRHTRTCVMKYPGNVEATLVINSETPKNACTILKDAYNNSL